MRADNQTIVLMAATAVLFIILGLSIWVIVHHKDYPPAVVISAGMFVFGSLGGAALKVFGLPW